MKKLSRPIPSRASQPDAAPAGEFHRLLRDHVPVLYRCAFRWTGAVDRAEDLVQELLVRLYPRLEELRTLDRVRPWALRVMYRIFVDQLRRERSSPVQFGADENASAEEEQDSFIDESANPPALAERELTQERIVAAWAQLREEHRVVLSMHDIEGYSLGELSELTQTPIGTLKSRLHRARARLRELLMAERFGASDRVRD